MSTDKDQRFIDAVERGMPTAMAAQAVYGTAVPPRPAAPDCRCGHALDRHLPHVHEHQDACAGGTPGFCGCSGYIPAAPDAAGGIGRAWVPTSTHGGPLN